MLKRILTVLIFVLLLPEVGWGTNYYVRTDAANDAGAGTNWTVAKKTLAGAMAASTDNDTVVFAAGTYTGTSNYGQNVGSASRTYRAATAALDSGVAGWNAAYAGTPVFDIAAANEHIWYFTTAGKTVIITGITFKNGHYADNKDCFRVTVACTITVNDCIFIDNARNLEHVGTIATNITFNRCIFKGGYYGTNSYLVNIANSGALTLNYCKQIPSTASPSAYLAFTTASSTATIRNCFFSGMRDYFIRLTAASTVNFYNNITMGSALTSSIINSFNKTAGTLNESHNLNIYNPRNRTILPFASITPDVTDLTVNPLVKTASGYGFVGLCVDDGQNLARAEAIAAIFNAAGYGITFTTNQYAISQQTNYASRLQALVNAGNDIVCHAYSDSDLTKAGPIDLKGPGAGSKYRTTATTIELDDTGDGSYEYIFTFGGGSPDGTTVGQFITWINSGARLAAGWSGRKLGGSATDIGDEALLSGLDVVAATGCPNASWTTIPWLIDVTAATGWWLDEIKNPKTWLQNTIQTGATGRAATYTINYFAYPKGTGSKNLRNAVAANYTAARGYGSAQDTTGMWLEMKAGEAEGNLFRINSIDHTDFAGKNQADTEMQAHSMALYAMQGTMLFVTVHTVAQLSDAQAGYIVNVWKQYAGSGVTITTFNTLMDTITNAGSLWEFKEADATNGGNMWGLKSGSVLPSSFDITGLQGGSPAAMSGLSTVWNGIASVTDIAGKTITDGVGTVTVPWVSMGSYEYIGGGGGFTPGLGLSGGNRPPKLK